MSFRRRPPPPREIIIAARRRIARVLTYTAEDTTHSYFANEERQDAVERNFIAIGEAIKDLALVIDLERVHPSAEWSKPARFRDYLAHRYLEGISHPDVWRTIKDDLPLLDAALARIETLIE